MLTNILFLHNHGNGRRKEKMLKNIELNREEMLTALGMALAFIVPIWGGMYIVAKVFG